MAMTTNPSEDALSQVLDQMKSLSLRFDKLEEKNHSNLSNPNPPVKEESLIQIISPTLPSSFQHGIRASGLWKEKNFTLSREPLKYGFKLEKASEYSIWSFSTLKMLEKEGLSDFILFEVQEPLLSTEETSVGKSGWLLSRWREF